MKRILLLLVFALPLQAQTVVAPSPVAKQQFFAANGSPLSSGCIYTYITGTSTPLPTYTDFTGTTQNPNPIILDGGGFAAIWLSNSTYRFKLVANDGLNDGCASGAVQYTIDGISAWTVINQAANLFALGQTSDPAGTAGEIVYRSDIPCFRGFTTFWDCFVRLTDTQTLTNKTFDISANTLKNSINTAGSYPRNNGTQYVNSTIQPTDLPTAAVLPTPVINGASTGTGVQGSGAKLLSDDGTGATGAPLCRAATGGSTATGCLGVVYNTASASTNASIATTTMVTSPASTGATYRLSGYMDGTAAGTGCSGAGSVVLTLTFTDINGAGAIAWTILFEQTPGTTTASATIVTGGGPGTPLVSVIPITFRAAASTAIQYSTTYAAGTGCSIGPKYQVFPILEQLSVN